VSLEQELVNFTISYFITFQRRRERAAKYATADRDINRSMQCVYKIYSIKPFCAVYVTLKYPTNIVVHGRNKNVKNRDFFLRLKAKNRTYGSIIEQLYIHVYT